MNSFHKKFKKIEINQDQAEEKYDIDGSPKIQVSGDKRTVIVSATEEPYLEKNKDHMTLHHENIQKEDRKPENEIIYFPTVKSYERKSDECCKEDSFKNETETFKPHVRKDQQSIREVSAEEKYDIEGSPEIQVSGDKRTVIVSATEESYLERNEDHMTLHHDNIQKEDQKPENEIIYCPTVKSYERKSDKCYKEDSSKNETETFKPHVRKDEQSIREVSAEVPNGNEEDINSKHLNPNTEEIESMENTISAGYILSRVFNWVFRFLFLLWLLYKLNN